MNENIVLKLLPVCECGHVFTELEIKENTYKNKKGYIIKKYIFTPSCCPNCGKQIDGVSISNDIYNKIK